MANLLKGIDVSEWQGNLDWASLKQQGVQFAIIRCGYGAYKKNVTQFEDEYAAANIKGCEANNIPYGLYYFCYAKNLADVQTECEHAKSIIDKYCTKKPFCVAYDFEYDTVTKAANNFGVTLTADSFVSFVDYWNAYFNKLGYQTPVYTNLDYWNKYNAKKYLGNQPVWFAYYQDSCYIDNYDVWQYGYEKYTINGTKTEVDGDYATYEFVYGKTETTKTTKEVAKTMTATEAKAWTTSLLKHYPFVYCPTLAAKTSNHTPHAGDVVLFYSGGDYAHTGLVYSTTSTTFTTIEGNTSSASGVIANGGGVAKKTYYTSSYSSSKFFRPDYASLVTAGFFASTSAAINAVLATAYNEIGYLEKANGSNLDSKTANAGSNNYTKYWRDIYPAYQAQPWCACFVTWVIQKTLEAVGTSGSTTSIDTSTSTNPYAGNSVAKGMQKYKNGSTDEIVYQTSALTDAIGCLNPYEECYCFGQAGGAYLVAYQVDGTENTWKAGYVEYAGKTTFKNNGSNDPAVGMQTYKNGSTEEIVYQTSDFGKRVGSLNAYENCYCFGQAGGGYLVCYKVDGTKNTWKCGYCEYSGKTSF